MTRPRTQGVTLVELLVTMVVSSVVLVGLGTVYMGASKDFRTAAAMREERYARQSLESELVWRLKVVPPDMMPSGAQLPPGPAAAPGFLLTYVDDKGVTQPRKILAFDYLTNDTRSFVQDTYANGIPLIVDGPGCTVLIPDPTPAAPYNVNELEKVDVKTAAIFQYQSVVYWIERPVRASGDSFRTMARNGTLPGALTNLFAATPAPILNATPPMPLAVGIETFEPWIQEPPAGTPSGPCGSVQLAEYISRRRVQWRYTQYSFGQ